MKTLGYLTALLASLSLTACGGGGGGGTAKPAPGGGTVVTAPYYTHAELAQEFVDALNFDGGYDVDLVKTNTLQFDYIVVYDHDLGTYDAYDIGSYDVGDNLLNYLDTNEWSFYYDLDPIGFNEYEDWATGIIFEKTAASPKDRLKMAALEEGIKINKAAETLQAQFGLSQERSKEVAKLAVVWQKTPKERMSDADHDQFAEEILGHSITEYKAAVDAKLSGDNSSLTDLINETAEFNDISVEHANDIVSGVFGQQIQ